MADLQEPFRYVKDLQGQLLVRNPALSSADGERTFQSGSGDFHEDISSQTYKTSIARIRAATEPLNPNIIYKTVDFGVPAEWLVDESDTMSEDDTGTVLVTAGGQRLKRQFSGIYNIRDFGGIPGEDCTDAIVKAIASTPDRVKGPDGEYGYSTYSTNYIYFPPSNQPYYFNEKIEVAPWKNVIFYTDSIAGAALEFTGTGGIGIEFQPGGVGRVIGVENLAIRHCGVDIIGGNSGSIIFRGAQFQYAPLFGIRTIDAADAGYDGPNESSGINVVRCLFEYCDFTACKFPMKIQASTYLLNTIYKCKFNIAYSSALTLDGIGIIVEDCEFQLINFDDDPNNKYSYIHIPAELHEAAHIDIINCRFGSETLANNRPPVNTITIGPLGDYSSGAYNVGNITIRGNRFFADQQGRTDHAIVINANLNNSAIESNYFRQYNGDLVKEGFYESGSGNLLGNNLWANNKVFDNNAAGVFSANGAMFDYPASRSISVPLLRRRGVAKNLISSNDDLSAWTTSNTSVAMTETGPYGDANSAAVVQRTSTGNASVRRSITLSGGGTHTFSVWLKAGDTNICRIGLQESSGGRYLIPPGTTLYLSDQWERYTFSVSLAQAVNPILWIFEGVSGSSETSGSICVYRPSLYAGGQIPDFSMDRLSSDTQYRPSPQFQSLMLGDRYIGYGAAAPTSGYYRRNDMIFNTTPAAGAPIGWVCVSTGSPGTWQPFGGISGSQTEITGSTVNLSLGTDFYKDITANLTLALSNAEDGKKASISIRNDDSSPHTVTITGVPFPDGANNEIPAGGRAHISLQQINGVMDASIVIYDAPTT